MVINEEELIAIHKMLDEAIINVEIVRDTWRSINWSPIDQNILVYTATITAFQKEQIDQLFVDLLGNSTTQEINTF